MNAYVRITKNTWYEITTYRLNFVMYRVRNVLTFLTMYFLWAAITPTTGEIFDYTYNQILTYVMGTGIISAFVLSSRSYAIGDDINQGNLSNYLLKPVQYIMYWAAKDVGDKVMNIMFAIAELIILFVLLRPPFLLLTDSVYIVFFLFAILIGMILYFLCNILLGVIGFWSPEVWAPRFIFMILIGFFSGSYFPLDILPDPLYRLFSLLPFQYFIYFPLRVYLQQASVSEILISFLTGSVWIVGLIGLLQFAWKRGLLRYTAQGR